MKIKTQKAAVRTPKGNFILPILSFSWNKRQFMMVLFGLAIIFTKNG